MGLNLLIGLPAERPGGLLLSILFFIISAAGGIIAGLAYATVGASLPRASLPLQGISAFLRGIPLLMLIFVLAHLSDLSLSVVALLALVLYSFSHIGEILRSFLTAYPSSLADQACVIGISPIAEWIQLRFPWTLRHAWQAISTHWVSLLKDTGALVVLGIGELTTVAKAISETPASYDRWTVVLALAAILYLGATLSLIRLLSFMGRRMKCPLHNNQEAERVP